RIGAGVERRSKRNRCVCRCRYAFPTGHLVVVNRTICRRNGRRRLRSRESWEPAHVHRAVPIARIHLRVQSRSPRLHALELHYRRAGRNQRDPKGSDRSGWRFEFADARRRYRSDACVAQRSTTDRLRAAGDRLDGSTGIGAHARATTISLGLRHAPVSLETSRHGFQLELSRARMVQFAEHLVFSDHSRRNYTGRGLVFARFVAVRRMGGGFAVRDGISFDGRHSRHARLHFGKGTGQARVADLADATDLSADVELLHLESNSPRDQRCVGELGQTGTNRERARARLTSMLDVGRWALGVSFLTMSIFATTSCKKSVSQQNAVDPNEPGEAVIPEHGAYAGAFMDFGDQEDDVALETIEDFEQMVGKHQAIIASSSYWGEQTFPTANLNVVWRHRSLPLVFWSPWDRPYVQNRGPD